MRNPAVLVGFFVVRWRADLTLGVDRVQFMGSSYLFSMYSKEEGSEHWSHARQQLERRRTMLGRVRWVQRGLSVGFALLIGVLGGGYVLSLNAQNVAGYEVNRLMLEQSALKEDMHKLQAKIARASANDYIAQSPLSGKMVLQGTPSFLVLEPSQVVQAGESTNIR